MKKVTNLINSEPSVEEMKQFGEKYKKYWAKLCTNEFFVKLVDKNLKDAAVCAEMVIAGKIPKKHSDLYPNKDNS